MNECKLKDCPCRESDEWFINSPEFGNCFWNYFRNNKKVHTLSEISKLTDLSISAVTSIEKKSIKKIQKSIQKKLEEV